MNQKELQQKVRDDQNEYFGSLQRWIERHMEMGVEDRLRHWRTLQEKQQNVIMSIISLREKSLRESKEKLEKAFTPRLKEMLKDKMEEKNNG